MADVGKYGTADHTLQKNRPVAGPGGQQMNLQADLRMRATIAN
jgi:hypothetical protein